MRSHVSKPKRPISLCVPSRSQSASVRHVISSAVEARAAETLIMARGPSGPLHGIPIGLKDIVDPKNPRSAMEWYWPTTDDIKGGLPGYKPTTKGHPRMIKEAARLILQSERPVIYAGQGVHYAKAWDELRALAEAWNIPVTTSIEGKSAFPEDHPLSLGSGGRANPRPVKTFLTEADVILGVGCSFALTGFGVPMPAGKTIIHATLDPADLNKDVAAKYGLIGDARLTLAALIEGMANHDKARAEARAGVPARIRELREACEAAAASPSAAARCRRRRPSSATGR